jgi:hypothetical protein
MWCLAIGILVALAGSARGQGGTGEDVCACTPSTYEFTLDFSLTCPPVNVTKNGGVTTTYCNAGGFGNSTQNITDFVPVSH